MISLEEAQSLLLQHIKTKETEYANLIDAKDRILAQDIYSAIDNPPFNRSPLDGYAIMAEDLVNANKNNPKVLKVIDKIYAGCVSKLILKKDEAIRIMTGAPIPMGADCIVKQEDTEEDGDLVKIFVNHNPYDNFCYKGEDFKQGTKVLEKNIKITSSEIMALASLGFNKVSVYKKPVIGVLTTGDELQNPGQKLKEGKIYNSNGYFLYSRLLELGSLPKMENLISDDDNDIAKAIKEMEKECDVMVSTGGVSVGEKDRVKETVQSLGYKIIFWKVDIKPGSPMFAAVKNNKLFIGLSGTPVAAATTFELMVRPLIANMLNCKNIDLRKIRATLQDDFKKVTAKRRFLRVRLENEKENKVYINNVYQTPGQVHTMINSNALLEIKPNRALNKGSIVEIII